MRATRVCRLTQFTCLILLLALCFTAMVPAEAEAVELTTGLIIAGVVIVVVVVAIVVIANIRERQRGTASSDGAGEILVAYERQTP